jgi:hypothetical protein
MKIEKLIERKLEGLYVNQVVHNKYKNLTNEEKGMIREKKKQYAVLLDELEVSWRVQNKVAFEATKPENWEISNKDVIRKVLKNV